MDSYLVDRIDASGDCWEWTGSRNQYGYGLDRRGGVNRSAHRVIYQELVGPVDKSLDVDHLCCNRGCVNPDHLEPVSRGENIRRGWRFKRTRCVRGHYLVNSYIRPNGTRQCKRCSSIRGYARRATLRSEGG